MSQRGNKSNSKQKRPLREEEEEEEDDYALEEEEEEVSTKTAKKRRKKNDDEPSSSLATQIDISVDERKNLLSQLVRYMIFVDAKKQPIRREDLQKEIMSKGNYSKKRGLLDELLKEAAQHLEEVFGFELKEISASISSDKFTTDKKVKQGNKIWILRQKQQLIQLNQNSTPTQDISDLSIMNKIFTDEVHLSHMGFLFTVLAIIICHDQKITEPTMWEYLRKHCQIQKDKSHPILGNVQKLMEHFVKQMYLIHKKDKPTVSSRVAKADTEDTPYYYTLGPRAANEITSKLNILEFLAKVTGNTISKSTRSRYMSEQNTEQYQPLATDEE